MADFVKRLQAVEPFDPTRIYMGEGGFLALLREAFWAGADYADEGSYHGAPDFEAWVAERLGRAA